jgi:hypothetical protein
MFMDTRAYYQSETTSTEGIDYLEDCSRSVELVREEGRDGHLGSFGFTLVQEKPARIGLIMPGGFLM